MRRIGPPSMFWCERSARADKDGGTSIPLLPEGRAPEKTCAYCSDRTADGVYNIGC